MKSFYGVFPRNTGEAFPATLEYGAAISGPYKNHSNEYWKKTFKWVFLFCSVLIAGMIYAS